MKLKDAIADRLATTEGPAPWVQADQALHVLEQSTEDVAAWFRQHVMDTERATLELERIRVYPSIFSNRFQIVYRGTRGEVALSIRDDPDGEGDRFWIDGQYTGRRGWQVQADFFRFVDALIFADQLDRFDPKPKGLIWRVKTFLGVRNG